MSEINGKLNNVQNIKGVISNSESLNANVNLNVGLVPEIQIGETITLNSDEKAFVELDEKSTRIKPIFNFGIPKGDKGETSAGTKYYEGEGIEISEENVLNITKATTEILGGIKVGENLSVDENGVLSAIGGGISELPIASSETLGGIKVGGNLTIDTNGVLNAIAGCEITRYDDGGVVIIEELPDGVHLIASGNIYVDKAKTKQIGNTFDTSGDYKYALVIKKGTTSYYICNMFGRLQINQYINNGSKNKILGLYMPKDNLTSTSTSEPLSAKQGKVLNDKITTLNNSLSTLSNTVGDINSILQTLVIVEEDV